LSDPNTRDLWDASYLEDEKKVHWKQIGAVIQTEKGFSLKLEMIPIGWNGWAVLYEPKPKEEKAAEKSGHFDDMKDDIPF